MQRACTATCQIDIRYRCPVTIAMLIFARIAIGAMNIKQEIMKLECVIDATHFIVETAMRWTYVLTALRLFAEVALL